MMKATARVFHCRYRHPGCEFWAPQGFYVRSTTRLGNYVHMPICKPCLDNEIHRPK